MTSTCPGGEPLGEEGAGFYGIMKLQRERLYMSIMANVTAELALEESIRYAKLREAFGKPLVGFQVTRHKLVEMATLTEVSREFTYRVAARMQAEEVWSKRFPWPRFSLQRSATRSAITQSRSTAAGYMRECLVERLYRDSRILSIGGGTTEIMKEIISKIIL